MRWWSNKRKNDRQKLRPPQPEKNGERKSEEVLRKSEEKLKEAMRDRVEVKKVTEKSKRLQVNDKLAEALYQAMRRQNG